MNYARLSGDPEIDALLFGTAWTTGVDGTALTSLSYSFPGGQSLWTGYGSSGEPSAGFIPLGGGERQAVRDALLSWSSVAKLQFQEVSDDANGFGTLRFGYTTLGMDANQLGYTYAPTDSANGGDVWLNALLKDSLYANFTAEGLSSYVVLHELGHALGLKHPHAESPANSATLGSLEDSLFNTVMSYYAWPGVTLTPANINRLPTTPMALDIDALQALYGANTSYRDGNDTYSYDGDGEYLETLFDTGGEDTIQLSGSRGAEIDLRPDAWSRLGMAVQINGGAIQNADTVRIYRSTQIENASGGEGNDSLIGNDLANQLRGNPGNDTLQGGAGIDVAGYSGNRLDYAITKLADGYMVADRNAADGDDGTDLLSGIERLDFADIAMDLCTDVHFIAYDWNAHTLLDRVGISAVGIAGTRTTGADGSTSFIGVTDARLALEVARAVTDAESDITRTAVNLQDAIAILKMIVGLEVNGAGKPLSPYQALAADFDANGQVQLTDAISVLKHAVGLDAPAPVWHFASETDALPSLSVLDPGAAPVISIDLTGTILPAHAGLVAYLSGDVDGSFAGADAALDLDQLQSDYFTTLARIHGLDPAQFGIYPPTT